MSEKKDFIDINQKRQSLKERVREKLVSLQQKFTQEHSPFCFRCAKIDYEKEIGEEFAEAERSKRNVNLDKIYKRLDFTPYSDIKRFKKIAEQDEMADSIIQGMKIKKKIGVSKQYVCKIRGCGHKVFEPIKIEEPTPAS